MSTASAYAPLLSLPLSHQQLTAWRDDPPPGAVDMPLYDRAGLTHGIVHIGVGSFHRAHMGVYIDQLLHDSACSGWAICGVGLLPHDSAMGHALAEHDHLYTVLIRGKSGTSARV